MRIVASALYSIVISFVIGLVMVLPDTLFAQGLSASPTGGVVERSNLERQYMPSKERTPCGSSNMRR